MKSKIFVLSVLIWLVLSSVFASHDISVNLMSNLWGKQNVTNMNITFKIINAQNSSKLLNFTLKQVDFSPYIINYGSLKGCSFDCYTIDEDSNNKSEAFECVNGTINNGSSCEVIINYDLPNVLPETFAGQVIWKVTSYGEDGNTSYATFNTGIDSVSPNAPLLKKPANNSLIANEKFELSWQRAEDSGSGIQKYLWEISKDINFSQVVKHGETSDEVVEISSLNEGTYFWRVKAYDKVNYSSDWSEVRQFSLDYNAPTFNSYVLSSKNVKIGESVEIRILDVSDLNEISSVKIKIKADTEKIEEMKKEGSDYKFTYKPSKLGSVNFYVILEDKAGNSKEEYLDKINVFGEEENEKVWNSIDNDMIVFMSVSNMKVYNIELRPNSKIENARIKIETLSSKPSDTPELNGSVLEYFSISSNIEEDKIDYVKISFRVSKEWINEHNINVSEINLYRYVDNQWVKLNTSKIEETADVYKFVVETPGFSYFAIVGKAKLINETVELNNTIINENQEKESSGILSKVVLLVIILVLLFIGYKIFFGKKRQPF